MMSDENRQIKELAEQPYKYGFVTDIEADTAPPGLSEDIVRLISSKKNEPQWLLEYRLKAQQVRFAAAFAHFQNGRRALADGNPEAALAEFRRAQQLDPTNELAGVEIERTEALLNGGAAPEQAPGSLPNDP